MNVLVTCGGGLQGLTLYKELNALQSKFNITSHLFDIHAENISKYFFDYFFQCPPVADSEKYISALIIPNFENLKEWAQNQAISFLSNDDLLENQHIKQLYKDIITEFNVNFGKVEQIKQFELLADEWTVENGLLTATMKLKRKKLKEKYAHIIKSFYHK